MYDKALLWKNIINNQETKNINLLNEKGQKAKSVEEFIAVGKEFFRDHLNFVICEDEESFFNIVKQKTYYCKKASLLWRGWDKLRGIIINKLIKKRNMQKIKSLI